MAQYRVLTKSFINNNIVEEGDVVDYDGKPGSNLELVKPEKPAKGGKANKAEKAAEAAGEADAAPVEAEQGE